MTVVGPRSARRGGGSDPIGLHLTTGYRGPPRSDPQVLDPSTVYSRVHPREPSVYRRRWDLSLNPVRHPTRDSSPRPYYEALGTDTKYATTTTVVDGKHPTKGYGVGVSTLSDTVASLPFWVSGRVLKGRDIGDPGSDVRSTLSDKVPRPLEPTPSRS